MTAFLKHLGHTAQVSFLLVSVTCAVYGASSAFLAHASSLQAASLLKKARRSSAGPELVVPLQHSSIKSSSVIGTVEISELSLSAPLLSDSNPNSLRKGVGHLPGTALPGGLGTLAIAGHRDTFFRPLKDAKQGMDVRVIGPSGAYHYHIDSTEVVKPEDVQVLDIGVRPELVLITCYPFNYIGAAPQRFIVHAHLLSALPDK